MWPPSALLLLDNDNVVLPLCLQLIEMYTASSYKCKFGMYLFINRELQVSSLQDILFSCGYRKRFLLADQRVSKISIAGLNPKDQQDSYC